MDRWQNPQPFPTHESHASITDVYNYIKNGVELGMNSVKTLSIVEFLEFAMVGSLMLGIIYGWYATVEVTMLGVFSDAALLYFD